MTGEFAVVPTPKGNAKSMKNLALAGGGVGVLRGATKWSGVNHFCGLHIIGDMDFGSKTLTTLVGCHVEGHIKVSTHGSLTMIGCTHSPRAGAKALRIGKKGKLTMLDCRVVHSAGTKGDIDARHYEEIDIQKFDPISSRFLHVSGRLISHTP